MAEKKKESKREKFVRIAEARTNKILNMVDLLGNCSNPSIYEYSQSDVNQIFSAIENAIKDAKKKFSAQDTEKTTKFSLKK
ncbi:MULTISPECIES: hypothetical protein [Megasphaera]|jgi:hypothetical protein|uniref:Uncharacterized protein n=1 Tax=Megasphaera elsdenii TaxID=907 RepID=A0A2S0M630_MEGEL|nr:hypothetical protein [Megasphaera elsdenii]AVO26901.1 hypothetical protein C6Y28_04335 [Megasphaera elsdenii]